MKPRTRWRISRISDVSVRSVMISSCYLLWGELSHGGYPLFRLFGRVLRGGDDRDNRRVDTVAAIGLDLIDNPPCIAIDEDIVDHLFGHGCHGGRALAGLPRLSHRLKSAAAAQPLVEGVVVRRREIGRKQQPTQHMG